MKLIGLKQEAEYFLISEIQDYKVKLPEWIDSIEKVFYIPDTVKLSDIENDIKYYINKGFSVSKTDNLLQNRTTTDYQYLERENYLHTNINKGYFIIIYRAIPIDENGMPLIPEEIHLIEALVWFNVKEFLWNVMMRNPNQFAALYQKAEQEWSYYSIQAKTASIFPQNEDEMIGLRNKYMKILPNLKKQ